MGTAEGVSVAERVDDLARQHPDATALVVVDRLGAERHVSWRRLADESGRAAAHLLRAGVDSGGVVGNALPGSAQHAFLTLGAWYLGALVLALDPALPEPDARRVRANAGAKLVVGGQPWDSMSPEALALPIDPIPPKSAVRPRSASATGGSTGEPRIIVRNRDWVYSARELPSDDDVSIGLRLGQVQLVTLPLHHGGFTALYHGLALGHTIVLCERFDARSFGPLVERHRVQVVRIVPTMMRAILDAPETAASDLSSVEAVHQGGGPCPPQVKRAWLDRFGAETTYEGYSSQERLGAVWIRGDEWLRKVGSVGRPDNCEARIYDEDGRRLGANEIGEIFLRSEWSRQPTYLGPGPPLRERDGFLSLGDVGYLDEDGYLYLVDRREDVINVGGSKVYPAEVERVLLERPEVQDAAVVGIPDRTFGKVPCAVLVLRRPETPPSKMELYRYCRARLSTEKTPAKFVFVGELPRAESGKIRRGALIDAFAP